MRLRHTTLVTWMWRILQFAFPIDQLLFATLKMLFNIFGRNFVGVVSHRPNWHHSNIDCEWQLHVVFCCYCSFCLRHANPLLWQTCPWAPISLRLKPILWLVYHSFKRSIARLSTPFLRKCFACHESLLSQFQSPHFREMFVYIRCRIESNTLCVWNINTCI